MASGPGAELSGTPTFASGGVEVALSGAGPGESTSSGCGASPGATGVAVAGALYGLQGQALNCQGHPPLHLAVLHQHRPVQGQETTVPRPAVPLQVQLGSQQEVLVWPQGQALNCQGHPPLYLAVLHQHSSGAGPGESTSSACGASPGATGESAGGACKASGPGAELSGTPTFAIWRC